MWDSLDYMEQHNSRSKTECIALALGAVVGETDTGYLKYRIPSLNEMKKQTNSALI